MTDVGTLASRRLLHLLLYPAALVVGSSIRVPFAQAMLSMRSNPEGPPHLLEIYNLISA